MEVDYGNDMDEACGNDNEEDYGNDPAGRDGNKRFKIGDDM
ncbi:hypothetical protein ACFL6I_10485 [candidate division KSB1 bacterium]